MNPCSTPGIFEISWCFISCILVPDLVCLILHRYHPLFKPSSPQSTISINNSLLKPFFLQTILNPSSPKTIIYLNHSLLKPFSPQTIISSNHSLLKPSSLQSILSFSLIQPLSAKTILYYFENSSYLCNISL